MPNKHSLEPRELMKLANQINVRPTRARGPWVWIFRDSSRPELQT